MVAVNVLFSHGLWAALPTLSPTSLSFGSQVTSTTSAAKTTTLTNRLTTTLSITSITVSGDYAQTNNCGISLAAGASCTINVTFTPTATGTRSGTLTVTHSASNSPQTVSLTGTGIAPVTLSPTSLAFGTQQVSTTSAARTITVQNNQSVSLSISSITVSGDYAQTNTCGTSVGAGASCTINVTFTPTATGVRSGTLRVNDNASNSPQSASLSGTGFLPVTTNPTSLAFGNEVVSTTSTVKTVTVTNNQTVALNISSIAVSASYAQTNNCGSSLAAGAGCTINVTFTPTSTGSKPGTLTITDDANTSPQTIALSGWGVAAPIISNLSPNSGSVGASVTISGSNLGMQANGSVAFNGIVASPTSWTSTAIAAPVPAGATTGSVVVTVYGGSSNGVNFTVGPSISGVSPTSGPIGTSVTISGTNFGATQGSSTVSFNGTSATPTSWATTSIVVPVPSGATTGNVVVTVNGTPSNGVSFTVTPFIQNLSPTSGPVGTSVTISGSTFGATQGASTVKFNGTSATPTSWTDTSIAVPVPTGATTGNVVVTASGNSSNGVNFTVTTVAPTLQSLTVTPGTASVAAGNVQPFTATGTYTDNSTQDLTSSASWTSSDQEVAFVDGTGNATAIDNGLVVIQAAVGGISGSATLTVTPGQLDAVITPAYSPAPGNQQGWLNQKAIAVGSDGFSRFVALDSTQGSAANEVVFVRCLDQNCSTSDSHAFTTASFPTYSMALGPDGLARIAHSTGDGVFLVQCGDMDCSTSTSTFIDYPSDNHVVSVAVGADGVSHVVYDDGNDVSGPQGIGMATCNGGACSTTHIADVSIYDAIGGVITIGADGNPVIVYEDSGNTNLGIPDSVHYYQDGVNTVISSNGNGSIYNMDVAVAPDGFGRVAILNNNGTGADFIECLNTSCSSASTNSIPFSGQGNVGISLAMDTDGNAILQAESGATAGAIVLDYIQCTNLDCSTYSDQQIPGSWTSGLGSPVEGLALDASGLPHMIGQAGSVNNPGAVQHIKPKVPTSLSITNIAILPTGTTGDRGCLPTQDYGINLDITYQVMDNSSPPKAMKNSVMVPHEHVVYTASSIQELVGTVVDVDICPSRISTCKHTTDSSGVFHDAPYGGCAAFPFQATFQQNITIKMNKKSYPVRTNNVSEGSSALGHGSISNGSDINTSR